MPSRFHISVQHLFHPSYIHVMLSIPYIKSLNHTCPQMLKRHLPSPHDQTQPQYHRGPDVCLEGSCHPLEHLKKVAFSFPQSELCHMRNNQPNHL